MEKNPEYNTYVLYCWLAGLEPLKTYIEHRQNYLMSRGMQAIELPYVLRSCKQMF